MDWEKIWYNHWQSIYRFIYVRVQNRQEAEDLTQETFVRAIRAEKRYENEAFNELALLRSIARNLVIDKWRQEQRISPPLPLEEEKFSATARNLEETVDIQEELDIVLEVIQTLTPEQQRIIDLRLWQGLSVKEAAERMGKTEGAVKALQYRAIQATRDKLKTLKIRKDGIKYEQ